jgi:peptidyl-prolyl cis-trans isomerase SurA
MRLAALLGLMWAACCAPVLLAQGQPVDRILAVVDEEVILYSDVKDQFDYLLGNGQRDDGTLFCRVFEQLLVDKLLLARARLDSLTVSEDQVDGELNRRIELMMRAWAAKKPWWSSWAKV